jgi:hypothetical protein
MTTLDKLGAAKMFGIGFLLSVIQIRYVALMLAGTAIIVTAQLPPAQITISLVVLILLMVWPQLLPLVLYLVMRDRADTILSSMNVWRTRNSRLVNVAVLGFFGVTLLWAGLAGLGLFG